MALLAELQDAIAATAERVGPSVVGLGHGWGFGSGVVIGDRQVLTSAHNLRGDEVPLTFADERRVTGRVGRTGGIDEQKRHRRALVADACERMAGDA